MTFLPSGLSWPGWHWWATLTAEDQAAWASGIGTMGAVFAAIWIALTETRQRRRSSQALARITAANFYIPLREVLRVCRLMAYHLEGSGHIGKSTSYEQLVAVEDFLSWASDHTNVVLAGVDVCDAKHLPPRVGEQIGIAVMEWRVLTKAMCTAVDLARTGDSGGPVDLEQRRNLLKKCAAWLPVARGIQGRLVDFESWSLKVLDKSALFDT